MGVWAPLPRRGFPLMVAWAPPPPPFPGPFPGCRRPLPRLPVGGLWKGNHSCLLMAHPVSVFRPAPMSTGGLVVQCLRAYSSLEGACVHQTSLLSRVGGTFGWLFYLSVSRATITSGAFNFATWVILLCMAKLTIPRSHMQTYAQRARGSKSLHQFCNLGLLTI